MSTAAGAMNLWVVVPCFNEALGIRPTLDALRNQSDRDFSVVLIDNASTDHTGDVIRAYIAEHGCRRWQVVQELQKGTGAAADSGFRFAITNGATHIARTDADGVPRRDWIANIKKAFRGGAEFVAGKIGHRMDDCQLSRRERAGLVILTELMAAVSPYLSHNRGDEYLAPYVMASGGNMATTASIYLASGGFPRTSLEQDNEDRALQNRIRRLTPKIARVRNVVVDQSTRRVKQYGLRNTLLWYWNRKYQPEVVDVR